MAHTRHGQSSLPAIREGQIWQAVDQSLTVKITGIVIRADGIAYWRTDYFRGGIKFDTCLTYGQHPVENVYLRRTSAFAESEYSLVSLLFDPHEI